MKMENGEWKMNDTVYGVSPGLVLHEMYTVGCADLGAPSLTIVTCVTVGATSVRPQRDRSLRKERPRIRLTIAWEANGLPYGVTLCKRFTNKYVPVVIGLRANNVRPYGADCTDRIDTVRRGRRTLRFTFIIKLK